MIKWFHVNKWMIMLFFLFGYLNSKAQSPNLKYEDTVGFIKYLTFPALDSLLTELYPPIKEAKYPIAVLRKVEENKPYSEIYSIYVDDYDYAYERNGELREYATVQMLSNRFIIINNRKIPIYFRDYDHWFYAHDPRDSLVKRKFEHVGWHGHIIYFDIRSEKIIKITH